MSKTSWTRLLVETTEIMSGTEDVREVLKVTEKKDGSLLATLKDAPWTMVRNPKNHAEMIKDKILHRHFSIHPGTKGGPGIMLKDTVTTEIAGQREVVAYIEQFTAHSGYLAFIRRTGRLDREVHAVEATPRDRSITLGSVLIAPTKHIRHSRCIGRII